MQKRGFPSLPSPGCANLLPHVLLLLHESGVALCQLPGCRRSRGCSHSSLPYSRSAAAGRLCSGPAARSSDPISLPRCQQPPLMCALAFRGDIKNVCTTWRESEVGKNIRWRLQESREHRGKLRAGKRAYRVIECTIWAKEGCSMHACCGERLCVTAGTSGHGHRKKGPKIPKSRPGLGSGQV